MKIKEMTNILQLMNQKGYGELEVCFGYNSNTRFTTINGNFVIEKDGIYFHSDLDWYD